MKVTYETKLAKKEFEVENFYHDIAEMLSQEPTNVGAVTVECEEGYVRYMVQPRSGTMFITELQNCLSETLLDHNCTDRYLTCVDPGKNAYKFYRLSVHGNEVKASYGRMGVNKGELFGERSYMYPLSMFWIKYYEKLGKGYKNNSDVYLTPDVSQKAIISEPGSNTPATASGRLFSRLKVLAKCAVRKANVKVPITKAILGKSEDLLNKMRASQTVDDFNQHLMELIAILQRPVRTGDGTGVKRLLAAEKSDFASIIERESDLLMAMDGTLHHNSEIKSRSDFSAYDIEVFDATEKQKQEVLRHLSDSLKPKVKRVYRVIPRKQQKQFDEYVKKNNIQIIKQLWHGSRNQNWMSIIKNGLLLNPDAIITGKMFGKGIYFAPSSMKSWNYTSYRGTSWANGTEDCAFMGLYAVAYGTPYDVHQHSSFTDYQSATLNSGANCLHAHKGISLLNDEIVFYHEHATVLNYIVEFE